MSKLLRFLSIAILAISCCLFSSANAAEQSATETKELLESLVLETPYYKTTTITEELVNDFALDLVALLNSGSPYHFAKFAEIYLAPNADLGFEGARKVPHSGREDFLINLNKKLFQSAMILVGFFEGDVTISNLYISEDEKMAKGELSAISFWETKNHLKELPSTWAKCLFELKINKSKVMQLKSLDCNLYADKFMDANEVRKRNSFQKRLETYHKDTDDLGEEETKSETH